MPTIKRAGSPPSAKGTAEYFTGKVRIDPLFQRTKPSRVSAVLVTFDPGARSQSVPVALEEIASN